jgi:Na+/proline symporter
MGEISMFNDEQSPAEEKEKEPTDYTGLIIGAMLVPVFFLFAYLGKADMGAAVCVVLGAIILAIKLRWKLRKHVWFWAIIVFIFALHIPLFSIVRLPQGNTPTLVYVLPIGIADFLLIMGALRLAEKFFLKDSSSNDEEE